jgi:hypothetical protein
MSQETGRASKPKEEKVDPILTLLTRMDERLVQIESDLDTLKQRTSVIRR